VHLECLFGASWSSFIYALTDSVLKKYLGTCYRPFSTGYPRLRNYQQQQHTDIHTHTLRKKKDGLYRQWWAYRCQHGSPSNTLRSGPNPIYDEFIRRTSRHRPERHASRQRKILCGRNESTLGRGDTSRPVGRHVSCGIGHVYGNDWDEAQGARL
jgi:hypothetical protein